MRNDREDRHHETKTGAVVQPWPSRALHTAALRDRLKEDAVQSLFGLWNRAEELKQIVNTPQSDTTKTQSRGMDQKVVCLSASRNRRTRRRLPSPDRADYQGGGKRDLHRERGRRIQSASPIARSGGRAILSRRWRCRGQRYLPDSPGTHRTDRSSVREV